MLIVKLMSGTLLNKNVFGAALLDIKSIDGVLTTGRLRWFGYACGESGGGHLGEEGHEFSILRGEYREGH